MSDVPLNPEQASVVSAPVDARVLVLAPAGTGKTHTLVRRLDRLASEEGLRPGSEMLVLSFSRAAVSEVRRRLSDQKGAAAFISAYTFDAFATRLLAESSEDDSWSEGSYDARIRSAVELLQNEDAELAQLTDLRHILVDEVQDLIGERAAFVLALIARADCGFTLLGDPAQSIYGFQAAKDSEQRAPGTFFSRLGDEFGEALEKKRLSTNYRARSDAAKSVLRLGPALEQDSIDFQSSCEDLEDLLFDLNELAPLSLLRPLAERDGHEVVLLARTTGEVLLISRELASLEIPHRYQARAEDRIAPDWIARSLRGITSLKPGRSLMLDRLTPLAEEIDVPVDELWNSMRLLARGANRSIDVNALGRRIRSGAIPNSIPLAKPSALRVSTIHRAKGLEFDDVVLALPSRWRFTEGGDPEELRVMYVALTRARDRLLVTPSPDMAGLRVLRSAGRRWARTSFRTQRARLYALETRAGDVDRQAPAGATIPLDAGPSEIQDYLSSEVRPGDSVHLELLKSTDGGQQTAYYGVVHGDRTIGVTSEEFADQLRRALPSGAGECRWPKRITRVLVACTETFAGLSSLGQKHGLGSSGTWLGVRLYGLGELEFGD